MYTLLIADDEVDERNLIQYLLSEYKPGIKILEATNGKDALALLKEQPVDILLSDIQMPFLTGLELAKEARQILPDIEILFFSGFDDFEYVQNALSLRAVNYILKPVNPQEFRKSLNDILKKLDDRTIQFANSEQYIETNFHRVEYEMTNEGEISDDGHAPEDSSPEDSILLQQIELAVKLKQPGQLERLVHQLLHKFQNTSSLSHIYVRYICTNLLQIFMNTLPDRTDTEFLSAIKEIYTLRYFSDIYQLIETYTYKVIDALKQELDGPGYAVNQIKQYIHTHYGEDLGLNALADMVYLNPNYLSNIFTKTTGCSLSKYIRQVRMEKAQELLLNTNMKVSDIGEAIGYPNTSYFCKLFQEQFGMSPDRFRQGNVF